MEHARPLPNYLIQRFHGYKATIHAENQSWYRKLAVEGQRPRAMVIGCCDSRLQITAMFEAERGEFFLHRNIANLVPPYAPDGQQHGTSAAIEYAVTALQVPHLIVIGHSGCGGVEGCYNMCEGKAPELEKTDSFVGRWMDILRPGYERLEPGDDEARKRALEKEAVLVSLENLMTFPFVAEAVAEKRLSLHGAWKNITDGILENYDPATKTFVSV